MSAHQDQVIDRALRAMGRALSVGADHKVAMQAALTAAASTGCLNEYRIVIDGVVLTVGFEADIEDGWVTCAEPWRVHPLLNQRQAGQPRRLDEVVRRASSAVRLILRKATTKGAESACNRKRMFA